MKIAVLHASYEGSNSPMKGMDPAYDPTPYLPEHPHEHLWIAKATAIRQIVELSQQGFDVAINLCDGAWDEDRAGIEVVQTLERLEVPFTGAGAGFYDPSRLAMKMVCHSSGVGFPAFVVARREADVARALDTLRFPMIVKHLNSYSSVGMTRDSRVTDAAGLRREVVRLVAAYGGALIEEFIEGREFTVLVTEPRDGEHEPLALQPVEFLFPPGETFKHFDLKWVDYQQMQTQVVDDPTLDRELREASAKVFAGLNGSGYGRCDIRVDAEGRISVLEINPNCAVFYPAGEFGSADFILANDPLGHRGFLEHLLRCAVRRRDRQRGCCEISFERSSGFGLTATRPIRTGEVVLRLEEQPHTLVSRRQVEQQWNGVKRGWFGAYCWPLSHGVHAMWSQQPEEWRPLNHSCDPNTWLDGLNLVARRDIAAGEPLTVEYATFCGPEMRPFECQCGSTSCRGTIRPEDSRLPQIRERFQGHASDFIQSLWLAAERQ
jgi:D-alanine-D-alanine ligase